MKLAALLLSAVSLSYSATCTSDSAGNANAQDTWGALGVGCVGATGGIPGVNDTLVIGHAVTFTVDVTVGNHPTAYAGTADGTTDQITATGSGYATQTPIRIYSITGSLPTGITTNTQYYACSASGDVFTIQTSSTCGGSALPIGSGSLIVIETAHAIQINSGGSINCSTVGVEVKVAGDIRYANPASAANPINFGAGCALYFDPSQTSPTARLITSYIIAPSGTSGSNSTLLFTGTSVNRAVLGTWRPNNDEARGFISIAGQFTNINRIDANLTDFIDLGDVTNRAIEASTPTMFRFQNSTFTRTGIVGITATSFSGTAIVAWEGNTFQDSLDDSNIYANTTNAISGGGVRRIVGNYFDKMMEDGPSPGALLDFTMCDNVFGDRFSMAGVLASPMCNSLISQTTIDGSTINNNATDIYFMNTRHATPDDSFALITTTARDITWTGFIGELIGSTESGSDGFQSVSASGSGRTHTISKAIILPINGFPTGNGGTLLSTGAQTNPANHVLQNTTSFGGPGGTTPFLGYGSGNHTVLLSEGGNARANTVTSFRGNIKWDISGRTPPGYHGGSQNSTLNDNQIDPAGTEYNTCHNCNTMALTISPWTCSTTPKTNCGTPYWLPTSGTTPGNGDVNEDPAFADSTRNSTKWAIYRGISPADVTGIMSHFRTNPSTRAADIQDLLNYVRQGFAPRNLNLVKAAAPSGYIGAVKPILQTGFINNAN